MSRRFITAGSIAAVTLFVVMLVGSTVTANHTWGNYHWERSSNPVSLELGTNFSDPDTWNSHFDTALADWDSTSALELTEVPGGTTPRRCKAANATIEVCAESYGNTGWLGIAQIWADGDHIVRAIAKMNDFYMGANGFAPYTGSAWRQMVMCQEVGHDFGLGHVNETFDDVNTGSCMDYTNNPAGGVLDGLNYGPSNEHPDSHDEEVLNAIYLHADESGSGGGGGGNDGCKGPAWRCGGSRTPPPAFDMDLTDIGQWGRLVGASRNGGQSTFVQDFGNGYRVYTHVTWTLEVAAQVRGQRQ